MKFTLHHYLNCILERLIFFFHFLKKICGDGVSLSVKCHVMYVRDQVVADPIVWGKGLWSCLMLETLIQSHYCSYYT